MQSGSFQGRRHLVAAGVDDAGAEEHAVLLQQPGHHRGQGDDDIRHDVRQHQIRLLLRQLIDQRLVRQHVARQKPAAVLPDAVERGVLIRYVHGLGVNVHAGGEPRP